jgi:hypothetical protein
MAGCLDPSTKTIPIRSEEDGDPKLTQLEQIGKVEAAGMILGGQNLARSCYVRS